MIEKVGYPLERAARRTFENRGYQFYTDTYYSEIQDTDGKEIWREIDIQCNAVCGAINVMGCEIEFDLEVVAECKYSSTNDYFVFDSKEELYWEFPILFDHNDLFQHEPLKKTFGQYFRFPARIENIAEVDVSNLNFHRAERTIYEGATQLTNALVHYARETSNISAEILPESLITQYKKAIESHNLGRTFADKEKQQQKRNKIAQELLPKLHHIIVHSWVPILILGKNNGLLRVDIDGETVKGFSDIGYGLYFFRPTRTPSFLNLRKKIQKTMQSLLLSAIIDI
jgi:hypothetical protein